MISVIVPVLNERRLLQPALQRLQAQEGAFELVVVDGGSTDGTAALAQSLPGIRFVAGPRGRAAQMNAGARVALGDVFLFHHVDTLLPPGAVHAVQAAVDGGLAAGAFRHAFADPDWRLRLISAAHNLQCRLTRIYYGDHDIFVRRALFERLGGFPDVPLLEDVMFCQRLRSATRARQIDATVATDARRFVQHGVWRTAARGIAILWRHALGRDPGGAQAWDQVR